MVWAFLAFIGVPLRLCALGILLFIFRHRSLRRRSGNMPVQA
jgi:hypothetical protein